MPSTLETKLTSSAVTTDDTMTGHGSANNQAANGASAQ
jgi:hypothetical protein